MIYLGKCDFQYDKLSIQEYSPLQTKYKDILRVYLWPNLNSSSLSKSIRQQRSLGMMRATETTSVRTEDVPSVIS